MGMSEADFFAQSILLWQRRIAGFVELHGGKDKDKGAGADCMNRGELKALMRRFPDASPHTRAPVRGSPS